jgi:ATP-dependent DNA helicase 2 subunit 1
MTNNDEPVIDPTMLAAIRTHARDLESSDKATLDLFPINRDENKQFDVSKFWQEVMFCDPRGEDEVVVEGASNTLDDLMSKVKRKTDRKRSYMRIPFEIAKGVTIGIRGYNLVVEQKKPGHLYLKSTNDEVVKSKQVLQCRDTAVPLAPQEIKSAYFYGGERVLFSKDEIATMRNFGPPGLTLLGFKPKSALKVHHTIKHSTFIYPDEAVGIKRLFWGMSSRAC